MNELKERLVKQGGVIDSLSGRVLNFGNLEREYDSSINHVIDFLDHTHLELTGKDRTKFLNNLSSAKIVNIPTGEGAEAFAFNITGHILAHLFVFVTEDSIELEAAPNLEEKLFQHFDHYLIMEDVEIHRRSQEWTSLFLTGNEIEQFLDSQGTSFPNEKPNSHTIHEFNGIPCKVRRVAILEQPGFIICCASNQAVSLWEHLIDSGIEPAGSEAFDALRIESKFPIYDVDISEKNLAQEACRTEQAISFAKGCYLGQETVARIDSMGHVNKELCLMELEGEKPDLPEPGTTIQDSKGKEVGQLTSSAWSPGRNAIVALGIVKNSSASSGKKITLSSGIAGKVH